MRLIQCDLCTTSEEKPHGGLPVGWFSYSRSKRPLDLCKPCADIVQRKLGARK